MAKPRVPRVRARRGEGDRLRDEILDAAETLLIETADAERVSIRAIGQIVGVTAPSIYRHFEDKDALLLAACERAYDRFDDYLMAEAADASNPLQGIKARAYAYIRFALSNPGQYRILFMTPGTHKHPDISDVDVFGADSSMKGLVHLSEAIQAAIDAGLVAPVAPTSELAVLLWSMVHGIASLRIAHPDMPWPDGEAQVDLLFHSLAVGFCTDKARILMGTHEAPSPVLSRGR